jgi:CBS domain-containing protein
MTKASQEMKARDIMVPLAEYPHMPFWASLKEAVVQLTLAQQGRGPEERRRKVLIFDEAYKLQGILTQRDILQGMEHKFIRYLKDGAPQMWEGLSSPGALAQANKPVKEFLSPAPTAVQADDDLLRVVHIMVKENADLVPVMEGERLLGMVRLEDVFQEISKSIVSN